jgi:quercetin 2,3-dioxygenase
MIERRPFDELPSEDLGWLKARSHFSCAAKDDPSRSSWGCMHVWNDEEIAPNTGFALQVHANIEIIIYVRKEQSLTEIVSATKVESKREAFRS